MVLDPARTGVPAAARREPVDDLPFGSPEKAARYDTDRYQGATGRNWWTIDPSIQQLSRFYCTTDERAWIEPRLERIGAVMGGPISERADITDKFPPRLEKYDKWGHEVDEIILPETVMETRRDIQRDGFGNHAVHAEAAKAGVRLAFAGAAQSYMLNQAEIGMTCALGTGEDMVQALVAQFAPPDVQERVLPKFASGEWYGESAQCLTERTGGADLAMLETTARKAGDAWLLTGFKWFVSNANGQAYVVLAKPEGADDGIRGINTFLVLRERRDGSRNGIRIRRLKDKLGTKAVASAEVEFVDAEAFLLAPPGSSNGASGGRTGEGDPGEGAQGDGRGLTRMMAMTNGARLGIAMMGLGCARRALVEAVCYASARGAFGAALIDHPLMQRKLAELIVEVEAAQALCFDGYGIPQPGQDRRRLLRLGAPLVKLRAARLGITASVDATEVHGGNGYIESWPMARIVRDALVNTIWEGPDNILCLDVRRGIEREQADGPFLDRLRAAVGDPADDAATVVATRIDDLADAIAAWKRLDRSTGEARLYALSQMMVDVYAGALLVEQARWERDSDSADRKSLVARLYVRDHLSDRGRLRGIDDPEDEALAHFSELLAGSVAL